MEKTELQKLIVGKHLTDDFPLLEKYSNGGLCSGMDFFSASYNLAGFVPFGHSEEHNYLPHFEFNITTYYSINVPDSQVCKGSVIEYTDGAIKTVLKSKDDKPIEVLFPELEGLFQLRNLESEGKILTIPKVKEEYRSKLPIDENQIKLGFTFRASSTTFGQLYGYMDINHPGAEELIKEYLETIDRRFAGYAELKKHFREKDDEGNTLWEDQGLQSKGYNSRRKKLHKAMFGDLKKVLKKGDLKISDYTNAPSAVISMLIKHYHDRIFKK